MLYAGYHFLGMHLGWWLFWSIVLFWVFAMPYNIPGQRGKANAPLDILKKRYALGQIETDEYLQKKENLDWD